MTPTELAYLAGVIDALGRVRIRTTPDGTELAHVAISTGELDLLRYVAARTGVRVTEVRRLYDRLGCSEHCDEPHLHVRSITGRWGLTGAPAVVVLRAIRPYLVRLADDADTVLAATGRAPFKPGSVRRMARLGWEVAA